MSIQAEFCCCSSNFVAVAVSQSCQTLCNPMDCSTPGLPVPHYLPEFAKVHIYCIGDVIQSYYPLMLSSPSALNHCLFTSDDQNTAASASVLPVNIQGWSPIRLTGMISFLFKCLSGVFSSTIFWRHQLFGILPSLWFSSHKRTWPLGRP